jgi:hypothetical protein
MREGCGNAILLPMKTPTVIDRQIIIVWNVNCIPETVSFWDMNAVTPDKREAR